MNREMMWKVLIDDLVGIEERRRKEVLSKIFVDETATMEKKLLS